MLGRPRSVDYFRMESAGCVGGRAAGTGCQLLSNKIFRWRTVLETIASKNMFWMVHSTSRTSDATCRANDGNRTLGLAGLRRASYCLLVETLARRRGRVNRVPAKSPRSSRTSASRIRPWPKRPPGEVRARAGNEGANGCGHRATRPKPETRRKESAPPRGRAPPKRGRPNEKPRASPPYSRVPWYFSASSAMRFCLART